MRIHGWSVLMCNSRTKRPQLVLAVVHILCFKLLTGLTQCFESAHSSSQAPSNRRLRELTDAVTVVYTEGGMEAYKTLHPDRHSADRSVAICLVVRDQDITEWVDYHRNIGVERIYLYDDDSKIPLLDALMDDIELGLVHYNFTFRAPGEEKIQMSTYNDCVSNHGRLHAWMAFIDADEYLALVDKNYRHNLPAFLEQYKDYGGLAVNWRVFGSGGHLTWPRNHRSGLTSAASTLKTYTKCTPGTYHLNGWIKTIAQPKHIVDFVKNPHCPAYKEGYFAVSADFKRVECDRNEEPHYDKIVLNHYFTKSWTEWIGKMRRGNADGFWKWFQNFEEVQRNAVEDCPYI